VSLEEAGEDFLSLIGEKDIDNSANLIGASPIAKTYYSNVKKIPA
jgi:hypothetical protein